ncbi:MAG: hypothetical protein US76_00945 [Parcubacteria group bacterium GW2011_GWA2_38_13b]|nr:MAG: hypothetical protein US76_00945 [Parcubacteria group bacterium GW2011_GWA2_38_13b]
MSIGKWGKLSFFLIFWLNRAKKSNKERGKSGKIWGKLSTISTSYPPFQCRISLLFPSFYEKCYTWLYEYENDYKQKRSV